MSRFIANARMYAVSPEAETAWRELLGHVCAEANVALDYAPYPAPQPLEKLWARDDLGAVFMCGYPIALRLAEVEPIAAPIPSLEWAGGRAVYRSDLIVRRDAPFHRLADAFGTRSGWTVEHSHSGFNAWRHHLLAHRSSLRPTLFQEMRGNLVTARRILDEVVAGAIDIGPLDAYWHALIAQHRPELVAPIRVLESTALAPMPAFVAAPGLGPEAIARLKHAFTSAQNRPWFEAFRSPLLLAGFAAVTHDDYAVTRAWDEEAKAAGYLLPA
jgi:ABC-type phosphate/phosphonate transport system substrate-binding protein